MFSIISTCSIKRTGLPNFQTSLLNVPYDLIKGQEQINVLVSIKRTGFKSSYTYSLCFSQQKLLNKNEGRVKQD